MMCAGVRPELVVDLRQAMVGIVGEVALAFGVNARIVLHRAPLPQAP
jgi:hypothetical protein